MIQKDKNNERLVEYEEFEKIFNGFSERISEDQKNDLRELLLELVAELKKIGGLDSFNLKNEINNINSAVKGKSRLEIRSEILDIIRNYEHQISILRKTELPSTEEEILRDTLALSKEIRDVLRETTNAGYKQMNINNHRYGKKGGIPDSHIVGKYERLDMRGESRRRTA